MFHLPKESCFPAVFLATCGSQALIFPLRLRHVISKHCIFLLMTANPTTRQSLRSASHVLTHLILMAAFWGMCNHYARLSDENAETYPRSRS